MPTFGNDDQFRALADNAPVLLWRAGPDQLCDWFNQPWLDFTGRSMAQEIGYGWCETVHPDDVTPVLKVFEDAFSARRSYTLELRIRRADGTYRWFLDSGKPIFDGNS